MKSNKFYAGWQEDFLIPAFVLYGIACCVAILSSSGTLWHQLKTIACNFLNFAAVINRIG